MKTCLFLVALTTTLLAGLDARAQTASPAVGTIDAALTDVRTYTWGDSRQDLLAIERAVVAALDDPSGRMLIEGQLVELVRDPSVSRAARDFACRQLRIVGTSACVPTLAALLDDDEVGSMARFALEAIPAPESFEVLRDAADAGHAGARHSLARRRIWVARRGERGHADDVAILLALAARGEASARTSLARSRSALVDDVLGRLAAGDDERSALLAIALLGERAAVTQRARLEQLAGDGHAPAIRCAALIATVDMAGWRDAIDRADRLDTALRIAGTAASKEAALTAIKQLNDPTLLPIVQHEMRSGVASAAAAMVVLALAETQEATDRDGARAAVLEVLELFPGDEKVRTQAGEAMARIERNEGYLQAWEIAGPYVDESVGSALLDVVFSPERMVDDVTWRPLVANELGAPGVVDLLALMGGNDRCAYGRVVITSDRDEDARLELGSDDAVKVWLNGDIVHRNPAMRGLTLREDTVPIRLRRGENMLLVKVTQGGGDWQFAVRVRAADGLRLPGVPVR